jgi:hypothetical protein
MKINSPAAPRQHFIERFTKISKKREGENNAFSSMVKLQDSLEKESDAKTKLAR